MSTASAPKSSGDPISDPEPSQVSIAKLTENQFEDWLAFTQHLGKRTRADAEKLFGCRVKESLVWGLPAPLREQLTPPISIADLNKLANDPKASPLKQLQAVHRLPCLAEKSEMSEWCQAVEKIVQRATFENHEVAEPILDSQDCEQLLVRQWLAIELPLTLAYCLPELPAVAELAESAFDVLIVEQEELLDSDGVIHNRAAHQTAGLFATWTRSILLAQKLKLKLDGQSQAKWEWFIRFTMRLLRKNGTLLLADRSVEPAAKMFAAALPTSTDKEDRAIARLAIPKAIKTSSNSKGKTKKPQILVDHGIYSEWAGLAMLQTDWSPKSARVPIIFDNERYELEICRGGSLLRLTGTPEISLNGKQLSHSGEWEEVCWYSDDDVDYLEVEVDFENDVRLQRQVCLLRADDAVFVADAVLSKSQQRIDYRCSLSVNESMKTMRETENNEVYLLDSKEKIRSLVLPLGLSEWKASRSDDALNTEDQSITVAQSSFGESLYSPWFVDLSPKRSVKPRTWRTLTVGEGLELVSPEVARAFRVRIGDVQWVIYRSLGPVGNRTFLGQNRNCEFFIGRFKEDGTVDELISIE